MTKIQFLFFISSLFLLSCSNSITGFYYNKDANKYLYGYNFISINKDSVYYLAYNGIIGKASYSGTWERIADTLFLDIPAPCTNKTGLLIEGVDEKDDSTRFDCKILRSCGDTMSVFYETLIINDTLPIQIENGLAVLKSIDISKIEIKQNISYTNSIFFLKNSKSNRNLLFLGESDAVQDASYSLVSRKFLIQGESLFPIDSRGEQEEIIDFNIKRHGKAKRFQTEY